ncbi:MAG TPA: hypothetical protein ENJ20_04900 [Bacteroidetes bacterium]|nr:hypothetical protein [Bacteroidota bacterium]
MNIRKIKLELTVDLMNLPRSHNPVSFAKEKMDRFSAETGVFKGLVETNTTRINNNIRYRTLALQFERCTLNLDLVEDEANNEEYLQNFNLFEN